MKGRGFPLTAGLALSCLLAVGCAHSRDRTDLQEDRLQARHLAARAETLLETGEVEDALAKVRAALRRNPLDLQARLLAAKILVRLDRPEEGKALLLRFPEDAAPAFRVVCMEGAARISMDLHQPTLAARELAKALELRPDDPDLLLFLGRALAAAGREQAARTRLERALERGADPRSAAPLLARVLYGLGEIQAAVDLLEKDVPEAELTPEQKVFKGVCLCSVGRTEDGLRLFRDAQEEERGPVEAYYDAGLALEDRGDTLAAEAAYRSALAAVPTHAPAAWRLGRLLLEEGRRGEGIAFLEQAAAYEKDPFVKQALRESLRLLTGAGGRDGKDPAREVDPGG